METKKITKEIINWDFFNNEIPIVELCEVLGIEVDGDFKIACPNPRHEDNHPSCKLYPENNTYHCFSCGETGTPINLVMDVKFDVSKDEFAELRKNNRKEASKLIKSVIRYMDTYFKGGIKRETKTVEEKEELEVPTIPKQVLNSIGFKANPILIGQNIKIDAGYISGKAVHKSIFINTDEYFETKSEKAGFLLDRLIKKESEILEEPKKIIKAYPLLDENARNVLRDTAYAKYGKVHVYTELIKEYYFNQSERDFPADMFMDEIDEMEEER